jgi:6-phosphogluconolactonase
MGGGAAAALADAVAAAAGARGVARIAVHAGKATDGVLRRLAVALGGVDVRLFVTDERPGGGKAERARAAMPGAVVRGAESADAYAKEIEDEWGAGRECAFDAVLLALGRDAHVAGLFPGLPAIHESEKWVVEHDVPQSGQRRLSLGPRALNAAAVAVFVVPRDRRDVYELVMSAPCVPALLPAQVVQTPKIVWNVVM